MNGAVAIEQGNPANVPQIDITPKDSPVQGQTLVPAWTTETPTVSTGSGGSYSFESTGSSVAGSSAMDEGSDSVPKGKGAKTLPPSSGSGSEFNPKSPPPSVDGSGSLPTGSGLDGSLPSMISSGSSPAGSSGLDEGSDYTSSESGSVEGSSAIDEGSDSVPKGKGAKTLPPSSHPGLPYRQPKRGFEWSGRRQRLSAFVHHSAFKRIWQRSWSPDGQSERGLERHGRRQQLSAGRQGRVHHSAFQRIQQRRGGLEQHRREQRVRLRSRWQGRRHPAQR